MQTINHCPAFSTAALRPFTNFVSDGQCLDLLEQPLVLLHHLCLRINSVSRRSESVLIHLYPCSDFFLWCLLMQALRSGQLPSDILVDGSSAQGTEADRMEEVRLMLDPFPLLTGSLMASKPGSLFVS